ncbi:hypothetical protein L226DRAFT_386587 [Lentinus tigrinus ALCF2SS1-7]|uniref:uncharacterized protein n=1 Tax=Lentinus tigrinus ALCF2SS1-7 TaxID=1328758 RepID=UPI001165E698|nr:hypothetical protein L226DRAFT_386587 [Lentinus tigrinus ALCF2SS1-7]
MTVPKVEISAEPPPAALGCPTRTRTTPDPDETQMQVDAAVDSVQQPMLDSDGLQPKVSPLSGTASEQASAKAEKRDPEPEGAQKPPHPPPPPSSAVTTRVRRVSPRALSELRSGKELVYTICCAVEGEFPYLPNPNPFLESRLHRCDDELTWP